MITQILLFVGLYAVALIGMFSHFLKKVKMGETSTDIKNYFNDHFLDTLQALIATTVSFVAYFILLKSGQTADVIVVFGLGFMCDSFWNKFDAPGDVKIAVIPNGQFQEASEATNQKVTLDKAPEVKQ